MHMDSVNYSNVLLLKLGDIFDSKMNLPARVAPNRIAQNLSTDFQLVIFSYKGEQNVNEQLIRI